MQEETALREGQANDALHSIQVHLGDKAIIFQNTIQSAKSQASSTRAWTQVCSMEIAVNVSASIYLKCRSQLTKLPSHDLLSKYLPLRKEDLKASSAVADTNARGQRDSTLPWFWLLDVQGDTLGNDWMTECESDRQCMSASRSDIAMSLSGKLALDQIPCDRWKEENILVKHEMQWCIDFFYHKAKEWLCHMETATSAGKTGHECYVAR